MRRIATRFFLIGIFTDFKCTWLVTCCFIVLSLPVLATGAFAQEQDTLPTPGELKQLTIEQLMSIEVTSVSRRPENLSHAPSAIQVITQEAIRRSGASSLPEALRLASNLQVAQIDPRQWAISARGFNSPLANKLLVLIDGRTVYSPLFAGVFWDLQEVLLEDIDRIEVISGPGGALWGSNAVNGVINIVTRNAKETQGLYLEGGGGTEMRGFGAARYGTSPAPGLYVRAYGQYSDRDGVVLTDGQDVDNHWGMGQGGFRLDWEASDADVFTVQGDLYKSRYAQVGEDFVSTGGNLIGQWSHTRPNGSNFNLQMYFDGIHRKVPGSYDDLLYTYDLDFQHRFVIGARNLVVWGAGYRQVEDNFRPGVVTFTPQRLALQTFSAFVQDEIALVNDRLHLTIGTKAEHTEYTDLELQPNARIAWTPDAQQVLWASISRALRAPSRIDRDLETPAISGSSSFVSEKLRAYELGYRIQPHEKLSFSLAGFFHDYTDLRSREQVNPPAPLPVFVGNGQEGEAYGAELTALYQVMPWWRLRAGYSALDVDIRAEPGGTDPTSGASEAADSEHFALLHSSLDLPSRIEFDIVFRYVSHITNSLFPVPAYSELDVRMAWQPASRLSVSIVGQNLLHDYHAEFATPSLAVERGVYGTVTWRY